MMLPVLALTGLHIFLLIVACIALYNISSLFLSWQSWSHRIAGAFHLLWLIVGAVATGIHTTHDEEQQQHQSRNLFWLFYDLLLGCLGVLATLTAARDFPHRYVSNAHGQSGTLHPKATVTQSEMMEHLFYQCVNLWQALYLHATAAAVYYLQEQEEKSLLFPEILLLVRLGLLWLVTAPWLIRSRFPVHSFSHNWKIYQQQQQQQQQQSSAATSFDTEVLLYRIKKAQYLFYKHVILHGVNISMALQHQTTTTTTTASDGDIPYTTSWRIFWLLLNTSYVMEFFLQTMVKRSVIQQSTMLTLQRLLMSAASLAALCILPKIHVGVCVLSCALNFVHRHHDMVNTIMIASFFMFLIRFS
jgi:hypothetical protein